MLTRSTKALCWAASKCCARWKTPGAHLRRKAGKTRSLRRKAEKTRSLRRKAEKTRSLRRKAEKTRSKTRMDSRSPLSPKDVVDEYFIENRTRLLEIAAFLDRLDRAEPGYSGRDFRMQAFTEALAAMSGGAGRLERIQLLL